MSIPQRISQSWSETDTQHFFEAGDFPSAGTEGDKQRWRQEVWYPRNRKLSLAIGKHVAWIIEQGLFVRPPVAEALNTRFLYSLKQLSQNTHSEHAQVEVGEVFTRQLDYSGKLQPNPDTIAATAGIIDFIEQGNIRRLDLDPQQCSQTGMRVCYSMSNWEIVPSTLRYDKTDAGFPTIKLDPIEPSSVPRTETQTTTIPVPSGVLLISDWFRIEEFRNLTRPLDDDGGEDLIQSVHGRSKISMRYATELGVGHVFCARPTVVQSNGAITCGLLQQDEESGEYIRPAGTVGRVDGPLRWTTIVDREHLIDLLAKQMSPENARKAVDDYEKENDDVLRVSVSPGQHHLYFAGDSQTFGSTIANSFQSDGLYLEDFQLPGFALTQDPLAPTPVMSRKLTRSGP